MRKKKMTSVQRTMTMEELNTFTRLRYVVTVTGIACSAVKHMWKEHMRQEVPRGVGYVQAANATNRIRHLRFEARKAHKNALRAYRAYVEELNTVEVNLIFVHPDYEKFFKTKPPYVGAMVGATEDTAQ